MTLLYRDDIFLKHDTGAHPEHAGRLRAIHALLDKSGLAARCTHATFTPLAEESLGAVHDRGMIQRAKQMAAHGGGRLDPDTVVCPESFKVGLASAGACVAAVDAVLRGDDQTALCLVRPPGHHATPNYSMGFCIFNSIALAAYHARKVHGLDRVLIVDWDVHHGNGTQDCVYEDGGTFFYSIHRYGGGFYPGTGAADETGTGKGLGCIQNAPVKYGTPRQEYLTRFTHSLESFADKAKPQLILVSAGYDAYRGDPVGSLGLETEDFGVLTERVLDIAKVHCGGRVVSCLEGGYNPDALAEAVRLHLETLLGD
ncbi:MAG TPA: histone deacetylase [Gemmataceae bacterium]|nr:histone deacetylase [Gemmataceae bacterium]